MSVIDAIMVADTAPLHLAREFLQANYQDAGDTILRHWRDDFYSFNGMIYLVVPKENLRARVYKFLDLVRYRKEGDEVPYNPNSRKVSDVIDAMKGEVQIQEGVNDMPVWLDKHRPAPRNIIAFQNGLLDVDEFVEGKIRLLPSSPQWFSVNVLPFEFSEDAPDPKEWWNFLCELWDGDPQSVDLLREWFGYCLTQDTRLQKILMLVGPPRSGKGTIGRILRGLIGENNVCGPTLSSMASHFGLQALLGKSLAILSDARLSGRADQAVVVERLLTISGEDALTVDRKNKESVTVRLPTRLMLISNELPKLLDASGALTERFVVLTLRKSFLGHEDHKLESRLRKEMPGILMWALEGLKRLAKRDRFTVPQSSVDAVNELHDLVSPISAFVREKLMIQVGARDEVQAVYKAWCEWCKEQGRDQPGTLQSFGRDLRAAVPVIGISRTYSDGNRMRMYDGIKIG